MRGCIGFPPQRPYLCLCFRGGAEILFSGVYLMEFDDSAIYDHAPQRRVLPEE